VKFNNEISQERHKSMTTTEKLTFVVRENLCRAFFIGRTVKRYFAVRLIRDARQRKNAW
jgi:hypothetical protein